VTCSLQSWSFSRDSIRVKDVAFPLAFLRSRSLVLGFRFELLADFFHRSVHRVSCSLGNAAALCATGQLALLFHHGLLALGNPFPLSPLPVQFLFQDAFSSFSLSLMVCCSRLKRGRIPLSLDARLLFGGIAFPDRTNSSFLGANSTSKSRRF
jgi:hypothetical protein